MLIEKDKEIAALKQQLGEQQNNKVRDKIVDVILNKPCSTPRRVKFENLCDTTDLPHFKINLLDLISIPPSPILMQSLRDDSLNSLVDLEIIT